MGKKKTAATGSTGVAAFAVTLKRIVINMVLTVASCATVYAVLAAARAMA